MNDQFDESRVRRGQPKNAGQFASKHGEVTASTVGALRSQAAVLEVDVPDVRGWTEILNPPMTPDFTTRSPGETASEHHARMVTLRMAQSDASEAEAGGFPVDDESVWEALSRRGEEPERWRDPNPVRAGFEDAQELRDGETSEDRNVRVYAYLGSIGGYDHLPSPTPRPTPTPDEEARAARSRASQYVAGELVRRQEDARIAAARPADRTEWTDEHWATLKGPMDDVTGQRVFTARVRLGLDPDFVWVPDEPSLGDRLLRRPRSSGQVVNRAMARRGLQDA